MPLKIAIVVQGRFWAFDLARGLLDRGHDVTLFTNYPRWTARRFGLPPDRFHTLPLHGVLSRIVGATPSSSVARFWEPIGHRMFGRWAARQLSRGRWDVIHCWSGVSQEILESPVSQSALTLLARGSSHIAVQRRLLDEEAVRVSTALDHPSDWMMRRETREYEEARHIVVLSTFSARTFREEGIADEKLSVLTVGVDVGAFRPPRDVIDARLARVRRGDPLRILYVGAISYRKGLLDLARVISSVSGENFRFLLVGTVLPEARALVRRLGANVNVTVTDKVPQAALPLTYRDGDVFLFPTIEDGFPAVLAQAQASGLPIITTPNGAGLDLVHPGRDGWIVPIRDPDAIVDRLRWCDANRSELAAMMAGNAADGESRNWSHVAADFEAICREHAERDLSSLTSHGL